jgi:putative endonuclease
MPFTYILKSKIAEITYVGSTTDLDRRIIEHNSGQSEFTAKYKPWQLIYKEEFNDISKARKREKYLKTATGRKFIKKIMQ